MRILGVDPGSQITGYGLIEGGTPRSRAVAYGSIRPPAKDPLPDRLLVIHRGLTAVLAEHSPDVVCVETAFYHKNARSMLVLGHVRGVLLIAARESGARVEEYSPREIKQAVTGTGAAGKEMVQKLVRHSLGLTETPQVDASDALAAALCAWQRARVPA